jgi:hypothetical protein
MVLQPEQEKQRFEPGQKFWQNVLKNYLKFDTKFSAKIGAFSETFHIMYVI